MFKHIFIYSYDHIFICSEIKKPTRNLTIPCGFFLANYWLHARRPKTKDLPGLLAFVQDRFADLQLR